MGRSVTVKSGVDYLPLPDGNVYQTGDTVHLTDAQWAAVPSYVSSRLTDNGSEADPVDPGNDQGGDGSSLVPLLSGWDAFQGGYAEWLGPIRLPAGRLVPRDVADGSDGYPQANLYADAPTDISTPVGTAVANVGTEPNPGNDDFPAGTYYLQLLTYPSTYEDDNSVPVPDAVAYYYRLLSDNAPAAPNTVGTPVEMNVARLMDVAITMSAGGVSPGGKAFDGITDTNQYVNIGANTIEMTLDFGAVIAFTRFRLWLFYGDARIFQNIVISMSDDNAAWTEVMPSTDWQPSSTDGKLDVIGPGSGRFVKLHFEGSNNYSTTEFIEFEAYANLPLLGT